MFYYWDDWNSEHATRHGISQSESIYVVNHRQPPDPGPVGDEKLRVWGKTSTGRLIQVIYAEIALDRIRYDELEYEDILYLESDGGPYFYVIHARQLTKTEKSQFKRRRR